MRPLDDVRIIAIEQFGAGPWATLQLADLGAEVVKLENAATGGDVGRTVPPYQQGEDSLFFETFNRGKKSVALDLAGDDGRKTLHALVREADAVFCNLRGDQPAKLGLTYETLGAVNPRVVCCSLSGFGVTGPRAAQPAYDYIVQAMAGWMSITGEPDSPPTKSGLSLVDFAGGYVAALALLGGLWQARRTGRGCDCDVSLQETALSLLAYVGTWTATEGFQARRLSRSAHPSIVPFQAFPTADGWVVIACAKQKFWLRLCEALGRDELATDPRFVDFAARERHRDELVALLDEELVRAPAAEWIDRLETAGVPVGPINSVAEALEDPQVQARGGVASVEHPVFGTVRHVASPLRVGGAPPRPERAPRLGEHTDELLGEAWRRSGRPGE